MLTGDASTPEGMRLYAIGDTHGHLSLARALFDKIKADLASAPPQHHRIILLGDYCDRGPDTRGLIDFLIAQADHHDMVFLLGNHDQRLIEFPDMADEMGEAFLHFGGRETLASYGIDADLASSMRAAGKAFGKALPASHRRFFDEAQLSHTEGDYFFCHAGVKPGVALEVQEPRDLLWIRHEFLQYQGEFDKVIVHGHTPWDRVDIQPNRINVDTGAYDTGILSCVVLEGRDIRVLQTGTAVA